MRAATARSETLTLPRILTLTLTRALTLTRHLQRGHGRVQPQHAEQRLRCARGGAVQPRPHATKRTRPRAASTLECARTLKERWASCASPGGWAWGERRRVLTSRFQIQSGAVRAHLKQNRYSALFRAPPQGRSLRRESLGINSRMIRAGTPLERRVALSCSALLRDTRTHRNSGVGACSRVCLFLLRVLTFAHYTPPVSICTPRSPCVFYTPPSSPRIALRSALGGGSC